MKILYITNYSAIYGANRSMFELILELKKTSKIEAIVVSPNFGPLNEILNSVNVKNIQVPFIIGSIKEDLKGLLSILDTE